MEVCDYSNKWKNVWKLPLVKFDYINYVHSSNGVTALSHFRDDWDSDNAIINKIINIINGEINSDFLPEWKAKGCEIFYRNEYAFCVRGWGASYRHWWITSSCGYCRKDSGWFYFIYPK